MITWNYFNVKLKRAEQKPYLSHLHTYVSRLLQKHPATELIDYVASLTQCYCSTSSDSGTSAGDKSCSFLFWFHIVAYLIPFFLLTTRISFCRISSFLNNCLHHSSCAITSLQIVLFHSFWISIFMFFIVSYQSSLFSECNHINIFILLLIMESIDKVMALIALNQSTTFCILSLDSWLWQSNRLLPISLSPPRFA